MNKLNKELFQAVETGNLKLVRRCVAQGANVNAKDEWGRPVLYVGLHNNRRGRVPLAEFLLKKGASLKAGGWGQDALSEAAFLNDLPMVKFLIKFGANPNNGALHQVGMNNAVGVAKFLIAKGADIDKKNRDGGTPVHAALENCSLEILKLLVHHGADLNAVDKKGKTPLHLLAERFTPYDKPLVEFALKNGARLDVEDKQGKTVPAVARTKSSKAFFTKMAKQGKH